MRRALLLLPLLLTACTNPAREQVVEAMAAPPDFSVQVFVQGEANAGDANPMRQTSQNLLQPNRKLRVAAGEGTRPDYFPKLVRVVSGAEVESVYQVVRENHLMIEPTSPGAEQIIAKEK